MDHAAEAQRTDLMTITRHVLNEQSRHPESRGDFTILLSHLVLGCKFVASAVNKAGLAKLIGLAGETNVQASKQSTTTCPRSPRHPLRAFRVQTRVLELLLLIST